MADTLKNKETDPNLVMNVDLEASGDGYGRGAEDGEEQGGDDDTESGGSVVDGDEEDDGEEEEEEEEDDEPPPPMNESSGSDCDPSPTARSTGDKGSAAQKKGAAGGGKASASSNGADRKAFKPTASDKIKPPAGTGDNLESPLWTSFVKSRKGSDKDLLGVVPLKMWESFEKDKCIPRAMKTWYTNKVQQNRSVPRSLMVPQLPSGFPEFCHWVAEGLHGSCGGRLKPGFEPLALDLVDKVKHKERGGRASPALAPSAAPAAEARKKGRRLRKGLAMANGPGFAEKMQSALAGLAGGGIDDDDDGGDAAEGKEVGGRGGSGGGGGGAGGQAKAAGRAERAGARAEAEVGRVLREEGAGDEDLGDEGMLGPDFADLRVPHTTRVMIRSLKRAKALRRRSNRQSELLEIELERSLVRLARMETQYKSLVAETSGRECTLAGAISRAGPLIEEGFTYVSGGGPERALDVYSDAIKLLEVHVGPFVAEAEEQGGKEGMCARMMLGVSLHNRSVANFRLGNAYSGQRDARQAMAIWPVDSCESHLNRSQEAYKEMIASAPQWAAYAMPR